MNQLIASPEVYNIRCFDGGSVHFPGTREVGIDFNSKLGMFSPDRVDTVAFNLGSALIHELWHAKTGRDDETPRGVSELQWTGPAVDFVNRISLERGFAQRAAHGARELTQGSWATGRTTSTSSSRQVDDA